MLDFSKPVEAHHRVDFTVQAQGDGRSMVTGPLSGPAMTPRPPAARTAPPAAACNAPGNVDDYIAAQPGAVQPLLQQIRAIVREEAPQAEESLSYRMPAYRQGGVLLYFAAFKQHIGLYPPVHGDDDLLQDLTPYRGAKGNLSFRLADALPLDLIRRVARQRVHENAATAPGRRTR